MDQGDRNTSCTCVKERNPSLFIKQVITILEHQVTKNDVDRQIEMTTELIQLCRNGFLVRDLVNVMYLVEILLGGISKIPEYASLLEGILRIYSIPPILTLCSDVLTYVRDLEEYFSMLGYLLVCLKLEYLQNIVTQVLTNLLTRDFPDYRWYLPLQVRKKCAEDSKLPEILGQLLEVAEENMYPKLLKIAILMAKESDLTRKELIKQDAFNSLFMRLESTWRERYPDRKPSSQPSENIIEYENVSTIVWMLIKYLDKDKNFVESVKIIKLFSLWNIMYVYRLFSENYNKHVDRNNLLAIVIKLLEFFPNMEFVKSGLAQAILSMKYSIYIEIPEKTYTQETLRPDDYMYMHLQMVCLPEYLNFIGGVTIMENERMLHRLLRCSRIRELELPAGHACKLLHMVMDTLAKLVPYMEEDFMESAGPYKILYFIELCNTHAYDLRVLKQCLRTSITIIKNSSSDVILNSMLYHDGLRIITNTCDYLIPSSDTLAQTCLGYAFYLLNILYHKVPKNNNSAILDMITKYMQKILTQDLDPNQAVPDDRVIISVVNFLWQHIVKCEQKSLEFVKRNGVYLMLDIVNKFSFPVQLITLGALVDLCEYSPCIPYLVTWRYKGKGIRPLLMRLFREENKRLNVKSGPGGIISDVKYPVMGKEQWIQTFCRCIGINGNPVLADMFISCRPRIYALLQMLNDRYKEEVQLADEHYKLYIGELETEDQVTMLLAENFLALKLGEAWMELKTEIEQIPLHVIPADEKMITYLIERTLKWSTYLKKFQNRIQQNDLNKELIKEQKLYNFLQEARLSNALEALNELIYIARCSERMFRLAQKFMHNIQIDFSLTLHSQGALPHRTFFSKIMVTPVFNQIVDVESKINKTTEETVMPPVSPTLSHEECEINLSEDLLESSSELNCD